MDNNKFIIAYSTDNQEVAQDIDNHLKTVGIELEHIVVTHSTDELPLRERLKDVPEFIFLLVSGNLLKNKNAMNRGLFMIQELTLNQRVMPVIIDEKEKIEGLGNYKFVPTEFQRMNQVIQYMNYWQDLYLNLRKERRDVPEDQLELFDEQLKIVRSNSSEMSDFLKVLKNNQYWTLDQMTANGYELFFQSIHKPGLHGALQEAIAKGEVAKVQPTNITPPPALVVEKPIVEKPIIEEPIVEKTVEQNIKEETVIDDEPIQEAIPTEIKTEVETEIAPENLTEKIEPAAAEVSEKIISKIENQEVVPPMEKPVEEASSSTLDDQELLKISEAKLKQKGKVPLLDRLIQHRKEGNQTKENSEVKIVKKENDEVFENAIFQIIEEEKTIEKTPRPSSTLGTDLSAIFHDDDNELDSDEMISSFKLSTVKEEPISKTWQEELAEAQEVIDSGKLYAGLSLMREAVDKNKENTDLRFAYAIQLMDAAANHKDARRELKKVIETDTENVEAYVRLAKIAEIKGDELLAKNYLEKALSLDKDNAQILYMLGVLVDSKFPDLKDQAAIFFKKSIKKDETNPDAHYRYGLILDEHFKKPKKALKHFEETIKLEPDHTFVNYDLALINYRFGAFHQAANYYKKACSLNPEFQTETNDRAFLRMIKKETPTAITTRSAEIFQDLNDESFVKSVVEETTERPVSFKEAIAPKNPNFEKVVMISGATSGIGKATATLFAKNGYRVILMGRRADRLEELKTEFEKNYPTKVQTLNFDVRKIDDAQAALASLDEKWNSIDILINNAGLAKGFDPIHEGKLEDWETMIDTNVKGLLYLTRFVSPGMVARKKGHIINVCSTAGHEVYPNGNVYCATKHAVNALTKGMRLDLYKHGLRVSQVSPAHVEETEFARVRFDGDEERAKIYEDFQPLRSEDVANTIYFIATQPEHVNIQDIILMGKQQANSSNIDRSGR